MKVGVVVRLGPVGPGSGPQAYAVVRDLARRIEDAGFDSVWVYDHLLYRWSGPQTDGIWESWTVLSGLAEATQRVEIGTLVACTAFRNPALLAKMAATLDEVSGGRLILGLGAGWHRPEFEAFGFPFDHRASRFEEAVQIIAPLLRTGRVDFRGRYYEARECEIVPRGPRSGGPPLLMAGDGPRMLRIIARYADSWNTAWHTSAGSAARDVKLLEKACAEVGRPVGQVAVTVSVPVVFRDLGSPSGPGSATLSGTTAALAEAFNEFAALGVSHLMIDVSPHTLEAVERLSKVCVR